MEVVSVVRIHCAAQRSITATLLLHNYCTERRCSVLSVQPAGEATQAQTCCSPSGWWLHLLYLLLPVSHGEAVLEPLLRG